MKILHNKDKYRDKLKKAEDEYKLCLDYLEHKMLSEFEREIYRSKKAELKGAMRSYRVYLSDASDN